MPPSGVFLFCAPLAAINSFYSNKPSTVVQYPHELYSLYQSFALSDVSLKHWLLFIYHYTRSTHV